MADDGNNPIDRALSPCVRNCCLDENDICIGCDRTISEIVGWNEATENEKREILVSCHIRRQQRLDQVKELSGHVQNSRDNT